MTRASLDKALKRIGYRIENSWNGLNDFILDHNNKRTGFVVSEDGKKLEMRRDMFSGSFNGSIILTMKNLKVRTGTSIPGYAHDRCTIELNKSSYISFYNHDTKKKQKVIPID